MSGMAELIDRLEKAPGRNGEQRAYNCPSPAIALLIALLRALSEDKT